MRALDRWRNRHDDWAAGAAAERLVDAWRAACLGAGVGRTVHTVSGPTDVAPTVTTVHLGPPAYLIVRLLPGQLAEDLRAAAPRLAGHLGAVAVRVEARGGEYARVDLLATDPLAEVLPLHRVQAGRILLGRVEDGTMLEVAPVELPHVIVQGQTRSGKSSWLYAVLAQCVYAPGVRVAGVDPSGLTLRPFARRPAEAGPVVLGLADHAAIELAVEALVVDMDVRLSAMPEGRDVLPLDDAHPLVLVVLDEYPGLLRALDAEDPKRGKRVRSLVARLLAESHKVGYRVLLVAQRAEVNIIGGAERAQCAGRLSFRVDGLDTVKLLHPGAEDLTAGHTTTPPGIALLSWPGIPVTRLRGPWLDYPTYTRAVRRVGATPDDQPDKVNP